jgi:DNA-directed RNA polymerase subunit beta
LRRNFSKIQGVIDLPNLIEIQKLSYQKFLQADVAPEEREDMGLQGVFKSVFPIRDFNQTASLEFVSYRFERPAYEVNECEERGMTYSAPLKVTVRLVVWDISDEGGGKTIRDVKEQEVYFGEIPLMTETGTFMINGTERVVVSQLHRSPGAFFESDKGKTHASGKILYSARVIPNRGSWLDLEFDPKDLVFVRIDRRRKMPVTLLIRALGLNTEEILNFFYKTETVTIDGKNLAKSVAYDLLDFQRASKDIKDPTSGEILVKKGRRFGKVAVEKLKKAKVDSIPVELEDVLGRPAAHDVADPGTGEVLLECNEMLTEEKFEALKKAKVTELPLLFIDNLNIGPYIRNTLLSDKVLSTEEALVEIYKRLRPGDPATPEASLTHFENLFFNGERYDLSKVGRLKINHKFGFDIPLEMATLRKEDILEAIRYLVGLRDGLGQVDDIDHLGNRRVRAVGELLENQYRIGLVRMERAIKERMSLQEIETLMPHDLINPKPVSAVVKEFFGSSQLSQFMDQTNPLSEVTHKRRLSALGPGGLTRERAGFEVRDVHATHYGRICPIETPEGPNIGLISSLSSFARVNGFGFIETPYRKVEKGKVTQEVIYCSALDEEGYSIAQANAALNEKGAFTSEFVSCRRNGEFVLIPRDEVGLMDVSPSQLVSVAASLIPFLEHDDANRALMGSNMQRQAVPLLRTEAPLIGTGVENRVALDSGVTIRARRSGIIQSVDAARIVVKAEKTTRKDTSEVDIYGLIKYRRSNQNTCLNQKPVVKLGQKVKVGQVLADGPSTEYGELALGQNVLVAFMPWGGYNFEDSILISETMVKEDLFTSVHIEEFECIARDTKLGKEEITRDIPNVGEEALKDLDESGMIRIGAEVKPGDVLVGKITPKGETQLSPEEKLLRAIFGEKAGDVKDTSLRVPPGVGGIIIDAQVFSREGAELDERAKEIQHTETKKLQKDLSDEMKIFQESFSKRLKDLLVGRTSSSKVIDDETDKVYLTKGKAITEGILNQMPADKWTEITVESGDDIEGELGEVFEAMEEQLEFARMVFDQKVNKLRKGDELPPGVIKMVKVFVAIKRKISVGDKVAGRHGNKGVISRILPIEDMPYMADGRPVDVVLNPLGVPSRMNVGQILEVHLGWAARGLGEKLEAMVKQAQSKENLLALLKQIYGKNGVTQSLEGLSQKDLLEVIERMRKGVHMASPVFDGAAEKEIKAMLQLSDLPASGQTTLFDGITGEAFETLITVGIMYILKLHHLVDDKIHARSIGPYSLVTQQPLGGKAQFGGQRLGEMEVWAMEAYGAAYALQEFLTVKSDDVIGRTRMYEAIVKGDNTLDAGLPESFNVLIKELQSLALNVELIEEE